MWVPPVFGDFGSLSHDFEDDALVELAVEFRVKNTLPGSQVEPRFGDGHDHLMVDEQRFEVGIAIALAGIVMLIVFAERRQFFQPFVDVFDQAAFVSFT